MAYIQDVEKILELCSPVAQRLNVPQGYASAFRSLRPALGKARLGVPGLGG